MPGIKGAIVAIDKDLALAVTTNSSSSLSGLPTFDTARLYGICSIPISNAF